MQPKLTDAHKAWIRQTVQGGAENLIADIERDSKTAEDIENRMKQLYLIFGMGAPLPPQPDELTPPDETRKDG